MSRYNISIKMSFDSDVDMEDMEKLLDEKLQEFYNTFENITVKITKDTDVDNTEYLRSTSEVSIKNLNKDYDF